MLFPHRASRIAGALWLALAVVTWNVVFDRAVVVAGRQYVHAASAAARSSGPYVRAGDWMVPAVRRALWQATAAGGAILAVGCLSVALAARRSPSGELPCEPTR